MHGIFMTGPNRFPTLNIPRRCTTLVRNSIRPQSYMNIRSDAQTSGSTVNFTWLNHESFIFLYFIIVSFSLILILCIILNKINKST